MLKPLRYGRKDKTTLLLLKPVLHHIKVTINDLKSQLHTNDIASDSIRILCKESHRLHYSLDSCTYISLLQCCIRKKALSEGKLIHAHINEMGFIAEKPVLNTLFNMYAKCGSLTDARKVLDQMPERDLSSWNTMIAGYARHGSPNTALALFYQMLRTGSRPDRFTFASVSSVCANLNALKEGIEIHEEMMRTGCECDIFVMNALIGMYAKCGSIENARHLFDKMPQRDVISWTSMIAGYAQNGFGEQALNLFREMLVAGVKPDSKTFVSILPACDFSAALEEGMEIHRQIIKNGFRADVFLESALLDMYAKCGSIEKARNLFDKMQRKDTVSWNMMIAGYAQNQREEEALDLFQQMQMAGVKPIAKTFVSILPACTKLTALEQGIEIHKKVVRYGFQSDVAVMNSLIDMYAKCSRIEKARKMFDEMHIQDTVSWTVMIAGYAQNGMGEEALKLFLQMQMAGVKPNSTTFVNILAACAGLAALEQGMEIHEEIMKSELRSEIFVVNSLIDMYAKCGNPEKAHELFDQILQKDVASWTVMIAGYAQNGLGEEALKLFRQMQLACVKPNLKTFASILPACADMAVLELGMEIHAEVIKSGLKSDIFVGSALVDMYAKCGIVENARIQFDKMLQRDVVLWTSMIAGYAQNGCTEESLKVFQQMQQIGVKPNLKTLTSILLACTSMASLRQGMEIHLHIIRSGFQSDVCMMNALMDMYAKCANIENARAIFDKMHVRDAVSWTIMIAGYMQNGWGEEALNFFQQMQLAGEKPNLKSLTSILPACATMAALEHGMEVHTEIIKCGFQSEVFAASALIDMYAKCGTIEKARKLFDKMHQQDVVSWTSMIGGYAINGYGKDALKLFEQMKHSGMLMNHATLVSILSACCHAGLVDEGYQCFNHMSEYYQITPTMEHYSCMVDLLGRAGRLDEAHSFINKMPIKPDASVWTCLLSACKVHNDVELGQYVAGCLFELDPKNPAPYVLLSNIYATAGRWDEMDEVRKLMKDREIKKNPGCSWIGGNKQVHTFLAGDRSHYQTQENYTGQTECLRR